MAESSWPTTAGSRIVDDVQHEHLWHQGLANGIYGSPADTSVIYGDSSGRQVKVRAEKRGRILGKGWYSGTTDVIKSISANASGSTRLDLVVLRLTRSTWAVTVEVKAGTPGSGSAPSVTQDAVGLTTGVWEIPLAVVTVTNGAATISSGQVQNMAYYCRPGPLLTTMTTRPTASAMMVGQSLVDYDTGQMHWYNGSVLAPFPGAAIRYTRITSGNLASGITSETTVHTASIGANWLQNGQTYEVMVQATTTTGLASPGDLATGIRVKAAGTQISADEFRWLRLTGYQARHTAVGIYSATSSSAVTFTVTALPNWSSNAFDVLASSSSPFIFILRALGPTAQLVTS